MDIATIRKKSKLVLIWFIFTWIPFEVNAQDKGASKDKDACYSVISKVPPNLINIKVIADIEKANNQYDFIEIYQNGDYQMNYEYVRFFFNDTKWYFETSQKPSCLVNVISLEELKTIANKSDQEYITFFCALSQAKISANYLLFVNGKMRNSLIVNTELEDVKGNNIVEEQKEMFVRFILEVRKYNLGIKDDNKKKKK